MKRITIVLAVCVAVALGVLPERETARAAGKRRRQTPLSKGISAFAKAFSPGRSRRSTRSGSRTRRTVTQSSGRRSVVVHAPSRGRSGRASVVVKRPQPSAVRVRRARPKPSGFPGTITLRGQSPNRSRSHRGNVGSKGVVAGRSRFSRYFTQRRPGTQPPRTSGTGISLRDRIHFRQSRNRNVLSGPHRRRHSAAPSWNFYLGADGLGLQVRKGRNSFNLGIPFQTPQTGCGHLLPVAGGGQSGGYWPATGYPIGGQCQVPSGNANTPAGTGLIPGATGIPAGTGIAGIPGSTGVAGVPGADGGTAVGGDQLPPDSTGSEDGIGHGSGLDDGSSQDDATPETDPDNVPPIADNGQGVDGQGNVDEPLDVNDVGEEGAVTNGANDGPPQPRVGGATDAGNAAAQAGSVTPGQQAFVTSMNAFKQADYATAASQIGQAAAAYPQDADVLQLQSLVQFARKDYARSAASAKQALSLKQGWNWETLKSFYAKAADYTPQLRELETYSDANPGNASARFLRGYHYLMMGHAQAAKEQIAKAAQLDAGDRVIQAFHAALSKPVQ